MSTAYRSTSLQLMSRHCPAAGSHFEHGTPEDGDVFQVGIAAHACLQAVAVARREAGGQTLTPEETDSAVRGAVFSLVSGGREWEGVQEPPMPSDTAWRGAAIARDYLRRADVVPTVHAEVGVAVDRHWNLVDYRSPDVRLRCILDVVADVADSTDPDWISDEASLRLLLVLDYKSSWRTNRDDLETLQREIQRVLAWKAFGAGRSGMRAAVVNLRTGVTYYEDIFPSEPEGAARLAAWQRDIDAEMALRDAQIGADGWRTATPGAGCKGCPYLSRCEPARAAIEAKDVEDPQRAASWYAVLCAEVERLKPVLRKATAKASLSVAGGFVGYRVQARREVIGGVAPRVWGDWLGQRKCTSPEDASALAVALLAAAGLSVDQLERIAAVRWPSPEDRERRDGWVDSMTRSAARATFGAHLGGDDDDVRSEAE